MQQYCSRGPLGKESHLLLEMIMGERLFATNQKGGESVLAGAKTDGGKYIKGTDIGGGRPTLA